MASVMWHFFHQFRAEGHVKLFEGTGGIANGEQRRDFVSVDDVVRVNLDFLDHPKRSGIFNVGSGRAESVQRGQRRRSSTRCAPPTAKPGAPLDALVREGAIRYIPFPPALLGKYQTFTQADLTKLQASGLQRADDPARRGRATLRRMADGARARLIATLASRPRGPRLARGDRRRGRNRRHGSHAMLRRFVLCRGRARLRRLRTALAIRRQPQHRLARRARHRARHRAGEGAGHRRAPQDAWAVQDGRRSEAGEGLPRQARRAPAPGAHRRGRAGQGAPKADVADGKAKPVAPVASGRIEERSARERARRDRTSRSADARLSSTMRPTPNPRSAIRRSSG